MQIPEDAPVRKLADILDKMDFTCLERAERRGAQRKIPGRILFGILVFGGMNGRYSSRKVEECCRYDVRYRWLLEGCEPPDHSTLSRFRGEALPEVAAELFGQLVQQLDTLGEVDWTHLFVDGTKLEARANRYSFVWRGQVEKGLARVREKAAALLEVPAGQLGLGQLRHALSRQELLCKEQRVVFVHGKGKRKSPAQRRYEELGELVSKWEEYLTKLDILGEKRNSYSKTDHEATFMRMKDDHMRNGQLKPAYNVQIGVSGEYIVGVEALSNRSDSGTLVPFLKNLDKLHDRRFDSVTTDAGYESLENYLHLEETGQLCFIKPTNYEHSKKKKRNAWVGRREDMDYAPEQDAFICQSGMTLWPVGTKKCVSDTGFVSISTIYRCEDCSGCALRSRCTRAKQGNHKQLEVNRDFARLRKNSLANITSREGVQLRVNRSIMVEGAFGVIKEDWGFRRFLLRGRRKVQTELYLLAFAFNVRKLHARMAANRTGSQLFEVKIA